MHIGPLATPHNPIDYFYTLLGYLIGSEVHIRTDLRGLAVIVLLYHQGTFIKLVLQNVSICGCLYVYVCAHLGQTGSGICCLVEIDHMTNVLKVIGVTPKFT